MHINEVALSVWEDNKQKLIRLLEVMEEVNDSKLIHKISTGEDLDTDALYKHVQNLVTTYKQQLTVRYGQEPVEAEYI